MRLGTPSAHGGIVLERKKIITSLAVDFHGKYWRPFSGEKWLHVLGNGI